MRRRFLPPALALLCALRPPLALAQTEAELASRRLLIQQAESARREGRHGEALELAERAGRIQMTVSLRLFLATEQAALGRDVAAFASADQCVRDAERDATAQRREQILRLCRELAATLQPRLATLTVRVPTPAPEGLRVLVAGAPLNPALYGVPSAVAAGVVVIEATAPGRAPFRRELTVGAGGAASLELELPVAAREPPPPTPTIETHPPPPRRVDVAPRRALLAPPSLAAPVAVAAAGAGVSVLSAALFVARNSQGAACTVNNAQGFLDCPDASALEAGNRAVALHAAGIAVASAGAAAVAAGFAWLAARASARPPATLTVLPTPVGAVLQGRF